MDPNDQLTQYLIRNISKRVKDAKHRKQRSIQFPVEDVEVMLDLLEKQQKALLEQKADRTLTPEDLIELGRTIASGPVPAPAPAPISVAVDQQLLSLAQATAGRDADVEDAEGAQ